MENRDLTRSRTGRTMSRPIAAALLAGGAMLAAPAASAAEDYYAGKTLTLSIGSKPGGGTDTTGRLVARFWGDHIAGKPQILVRNKGLQVLAANELQHNTRPDGLTVAVFAGGGSLGPFTRGSKAVRYDPTTWGHIGSIERGPSIVLLRKSALERLTDPSKPPVAAGSVSTDRPQDAIAVFGAEYLGWNLKFVLGYPNSNAMYLAYGRGEIDMFGSGTSKILERFLKEEGAVPLVAQARRGDFPDVKTFVDLLGDKEPSGEKWRAFQAWTGPSGVDKYFALTPGTPDNLLEILRASFKAATESAEFKKHASNILGDGYSVISGPETAEMVETAVKVSPGALDEIKRLRAKYGLPKVSREASDLVKVKLQDVVREGRVIKFNAEGKDVELKVSGSRSEVTVGGKLASRSALKAGMACEVNWVDRGGKLEARKIDCK